MVDRQDWLLMALSSAQDGRLSPIQTQKVLFIMKMEAGQLLGESFYSFTPYNYGPFDSSVYSDVQSLERSGAVAVEEVPGRRWQSYCVTPAGSARATALRGSAPRPAVEYLDTVVAWVKAQSFSDLLRAVYAKYPDYAVNTVFSG